MERPARHPPKATTAVVIRDALVSEETGSAFHPRGVLCTVIYLVYGTWYLVGCTQGWHRQGVSVSLAEITSYVGVS